MRANNYWYLTILCTVLLTTSCHKKLEYKKYLTWLNEPDNGFTVTRVSRGLSVSCRYIPPVVLAHKEFLSDTLNPVSEDSLKAQYSRYYTFYLNIAPEKIDNAIPEVDLLKDGVSDYLQYKERFSEVAFNFGDYLSARLADSTEIAPQGVNVENTYGLRPDLNIVITFPKKELEKGEFIDIVFKDVLFKTGINHFVFKTRTVIAPPYLKD